MGRDKPKDLISGLYFARNMAVKQGNAQAADIVLQIQRLADNYARELRFEDPDRSQMAWKAFIGRAADLATKIQELQLAAAGEEVYVPR